MTMHFRSGAEVLTQEGTKLGTVERLVMDPSQDVVTHLVVSKGFLFPKERVLRVALVTEASARHGRRRTGPRPRPASRVRREPLPQPRGRGRWARPWEPTGPSRVGHADLRSRSGRISRLPTRHREGDHSQRSRGIPRRQGGLIGRHL